MRTFKPRLSAWVLLLIPSLPLTVVGVADLALNPSEWLTATGLVLGSTILFGFNATMRLCISHDEVRLKRYGRTVWITARLGTEIREGSAGDVPILPSFVLWRNGKRVGYLLKGWFDAGTINELQKALAAEEATQSRV
ncbi:hypothetical protein [Sphingomonas sp. PAMC 26617]|uniref:hypothetical protein n=1 Tax=Sphingomonas sp. PAMC 26617 TaxID=1112216 RepID=UPI000496B140|nr:hypothetical protein [Sphingomonas sp. PAMC 26617]